MAASLVAETIKNVRAMQETQVRSLGWEGAWEKEMAMTPISCLENSTDRGFWWASPWGRKESDMTEWLTFTTQLLYNCVSFRCTTNVVPFLYKLTASSSNSKELIVSDYKSNTKNILKINQMYGMGDVK